MSDFQTRIQAYTGTLTVTAEITNWLTAAARSLIDKMPIEKLLKNASTTEIDIINDGVDMATYKIVNPHKDGRGVTIMDSGMYSQLTDQNSIHFVTEQSPVGIYHKGKFHILPNGGKATVISYPTVAYNESTISDFPSEWDQLVVLDAAIQGALSKMSTEIVVLDALSLGAVTSNINGVAWATAYPNQYTAITTALAAIVTAIGLANTELGDASIATDADVDTALTAVNTAVDRMNVAVLLANTEFDLINTDVDTAYATITSGEDIEKGLAQLQVPGERFRNGNAYLEEAKTALGEAQGYVGEVGARIQQVQGFNSVADGYLKEAQIYAQEVQTRLTTLQNEISEYSAIVSKEMNEYATNIQRSTSTIQAWKILIESLEKQYENLLRRYL